MNTAMIDSAEIDRRKQRWIDFLKPDAPPGFMFLVHIHDPAAPAPPRLAILPENREKLIDRRWADYEAALARAARIDDDAVPCLNMLTGTELFAEAFGCRVQRPADSNPFALPLIQSPDGVGRLRVPGLDTLSLAFQFDLADELRRRAGRDALFHIVDVQSPVGIAALIWEKASFYTALIEEPAAVKELAGKTRALLIAFFDEWFARYGRDYVAHCPAYFMRGGLTLSEDEIGAVSTGDFLEFFLPELAALSTHFGGLGIHCCASARHQWDNLKKVPGLRLLNLGNPPSIPLAKYTQPAYEFFADHCAQWHAGWIPTGPVETWPAQYPRRARVVIESVVKTEAEAIAAAAKLRAVQSKVRLAPKLAATDSGGRSSVLVPNG